MSTHKNIDKICCVVLAITLIIAVLFTFAEKLGVQKSSTVMGYEDKLFDTSEVHTINIIMDDWDEFCESCTSEEYYECTVEIDGETYENVAIRGKGNTSLTQVSNNRYSYKIEFDHYDSTNTYYGLDKLCLNNIIQDNTYMKDYLCYQMMSEMGVASPLCSYTYITVNGEDWGLYLAVEAVEESFLQRNYGNDYGELYKPDSSSMGGGRGNGENFNMDDFENDSETADGTSDTTASATATTASATATASTTATTNGSAGGTPPDAAGAQNGTAGNNNSNGTAQGGGNGGNGDGTQGSDDVLLKYIDDNADSYSNIFDNAKTDITNADKKRLIKALKKLSSGEDLEDTVDINAVIRYFVVHNFVLNFDSYTGSMIHNYYLYEDDGQMQMIPWDYNLAFGGFQSMGGATSLVNYPIDSPVSGGDTSDRPMIAWIFNSEEYTELYHQYFQEFISSYFDSGYFEEMIDEVSEMIAPYVEKDPTKFCTYDEFETGVATLKEFCLLRAESVSGQLDGTIGSTSDTQDSSSLIDAGDLQISDMGSMNNSGGGGDAGAGGGADAGGAGDSTAQNGAGGQAVQNGTGGQAVQGNSPPDGSASADNTAPQMPNGDAGGQTAQGDSPPDDSASDGNTAPQMPNGEAGADGQAPQNGNGDAGGGDGQAAQGQSSISTSTLIELGVSVLVLALGLVFAFTFKRRK